MTDAPPRPPNGIRLPFQPSDVPPLSEWDHRHFLGADGTGGGSHVAGGGRERATEFPAWVRSLDDLQRVHDVVLFVVRNLGGRAVPQPLDRRALLPW